jgi:hypothetical protein
VLRGTFALRDVLQLYGEVFSMGEQGTKFFPDLFCKMLILTGVAEQQWVFQLELLNVVFTLLRVHACAHFNLVKHTKAIGELWGTVSFDAFIGKGLAATTKCYSMALDRLCCGLSISF